MQIARIMGMGFTTGSKMLCSGKEVIIGQRLEKKWTNGSQWDLCLGASSEC